MGIFTFNHAVVIDLADTKSFGRPRSLSSCGCLKMDATRMPLHVAVAGSYECFLSSFGV